MADLDLNRLLQGGMDLASAFGRGDSAYSRSMMDAARMEGLVLDAAKKRNEMLARRGLGDAIQSLGGPRDLARLFEAGVDPTKLSGYQGAMQEQGFRSDAATRATAGDWNGANAALMGVANGPQQLAKVEGQNLLYNALTEGGGGVTTTAQGQANIRQSDASAAASRASAANSYASADATRSRLDLARQQFELQRTGQWNPSGKSTSSGDGSDLNPRQRVAVQGVQRNLIQYAAALTGKSPTELAGMTADQIAEEIATKGGRFTQGATARALENSPVPLVGGYLSRVGKLANESANSDILSYSQGAGAAWAAYENPTGMITNADRDTATAQMPNYLDPPEVQASKIRSFLELTGWKGGATGQPSLGGAFNGGPTGRAPAVGTTEGGYRFRGGNPSDSNNWERL